MSDAALVGSLPERSSKSGGQDRAVCPKFPWSHAGFAYILCVPLLAGVSTVRGVTIGGFNYTGVLWVAVFAIGVLLLLEQLARVPRRRISFPFEPWLPWLGFMSISFLWLDEASYLHVQYAAQLSMPVLVGILASLFVRSGRQLEQLIRSYYFSFLILMLFATLGVAGIMSQDESDPVFVAVRALSLTAVVIGSLFAAGCHRTFMGSWLGWAGCLALTVITGSRMASFATLLIPIANPVIRNPLAKIAVIAVGVLVGVAVFLTPVVQDRFFRGETGGISQIASGDFDGQGRFETWPLVLEEALKQPWLGHGIGSVQFFIPTVWEDMVHPHNDYLRLLFELGFAGLAVFLGVVCWQLVALGREVRRSTGAVQQAFAGAWLGLFTFLVIAFTDNPIIYNVWFMNPVFALIGAAYAVAREGEHTTHEAPECVPAHLF